jgi:hypothetical protein
MASFAIELAPCRSEQPEDAGHWAGGIVSGFPFPYGFLAFVFALLFCFHGFAISALGWFSSAGPIVVDCFID